MTSSVETTPGRNGFSRPTAQDLLERYGVLVAFAVLFLWNALFADNAADFRTPENLRNILNQNATTGIVAVGMTLVIVAGGIDLSVGSIMALSGAVCLLVVNALLTVEPGQTALVGEGMAVAIGLAAGLGAGLLCGGLNGVLVTLGRIPAFIATLGGFSAYRSITLALAEGGELRSASASVLNSLGRGGVPVLPAGVLGQDTRPFTITWNILLFLTVATIGHLLLARSRFGRHVVAVGGNETAARYSAIAVNRVRFATFVLVGLCAGLAGLMATARMNSVSSSQLGSSMELDAIAAVVIGGTSMAGGRGRVWGTVLGVLILAIINNMMVMADVSPYWQGAVKGGIIVLAVLIQRGRPS
jgi:ribose transport system permease protein